MLLSMRPKVSTIIEMLPFKLSWIFFPLPLSRDFSYIGYQTSTSLERYPATFTESPASKTRHPPGPAHPRGQGTLHQGPPHAAVFQTHLAQGRPQLWDLMIATKKNGELVVQSSMEWNLVPLIGGRYHIITQLAVYTTYIPLIYCLLLLIGGPKSSEIKTWPVLLMAEIR